MGNHETYSTESEWYTPLYIFEALECHFDIDVAAPPSAVELTHVPAENYISQNSLEADWHGFAWCNPPWAGRGNKQPWIDKMHAHGDGLLLTPDRSSAPWWQSAVKRADAVLFTAGKIQFIPGLGNQSKCDHPGSGTTIFAFGEKAVAALLNAEKNMLGTVLNKITRNYHSLQ